jgi:hypothetical protein
MLLAVSMAFSQNVIYSQDFASGIPGTWTNSGVDKNGTTQTGMWKYTFSGNHSSVGWPTTALQSASAANGWVIFDSDSLDNGGSGGCLAPQRGYLTTQAINCSGHTNVLLQFTDLYFSFQGNPRVVVNNGTTQDTIDVHADYDFTFGLTPNPSLLQFDISSVAANQSNVTVTFLWDNFNGGYYFYWQVDDISLIDAPGNDLQISQASSYSFTKYPLSELDSIGYYAFVTSVGPNDQYDSRISLQIKEGTSVVFTDTSALGVTLPYGIDSPLIGVNAYLPSTIGNYTTYMTAFSDSTDGLPYNNTSSGAFAVTDSVLAVDNGVYAGSFISYLPAADAQSGVAASQEWANIFFLPNADTVTSITAAFDGVYSAANAIVQANVYSLPANYSGYGSAYACTSVIQTGPKLLTAADLTTPNSTTITVKPVVMPILSSTGVADAAILQPGFYAVSITNVNDSLVSLINSFSAAGVYGTPGGEIASGTLTPYSNTHFYLRMNFGHNFDLLQAAFTRTPGINPLKVNQPVKFVGNTNGTGSANTQYSWTINGLNSFIVQDYTGQTIIDTFPVADSFQVCLTVTDGGNTASTCSWVRVRDFGTGVDEVSPLNGLSMVPNPTTGRVTISAEAAEGTVSTTVIDLLGNVVKTFSNESNGNFTQTYDLSSLSSGIYIVKIENGGTVITKKLSISKQ